MKTNHQKPAHHTTVIAEGGQTNFMTRSATASAHTAVRCGKAPRIVVAMPAGNTAVGMWFAGDTGTINTDLATTSDPDLVSDGDMQGVSLMMKGPSYLRASQVILDSARAVRDFERDDMKGQWTRRVKAIASAKRTAEKASGPAADAFREGLSAWLHPTRIRDAEDRDAWTIERSSLSGIRYRLEVIPTGETSLDEAGAWFALSAGSVATSFEIRFLVSAAPLTPLARVTNRSPGLQESNLEFLSYREALLAGSWQYLTYFGRDTLITMALLAHDSTPDALVTAVASVLDRVGPAGEVAHEESLGDQAVFERLPDFIRKVANSKPITNTALETLGQPVYDYKMIDGEYLLPPLVVEMLNRVSQAEAEAALGEQRLAALARATSRVLEQTGPWERTPTTDCLISLKDGQHAGNWRDSVFGLGKGTTPVDVSGFLVPAALRALRALLSHPSFPREHFFPLLEAMRPGARAELSSDSSEARARAWDAAKESFSVSLSPAQVRARVTSNLESFSKLEREALRSQELWSGQTLGEWLETRNAPEASKDLSFYALSLSQTAQPIEIMNADEVYELFYGQPSAQTVADSITRLFQPFPLGLMTPVGLVSASAGLSDREEDRKIFDRTQYHGSVIWAWQQVMMRQALEKQVVRFGRSKEVTRVLERAREQLLKVEERTKEFAASELWSWQAAPEGIEAIAFGQAEADTNESNAVQLWSLTR